MQLLQVIVEAGKQDENTFRLQTYCILLGCCAQKPKKMMKTSEIVTYSYAALSIGMYCVVCSVIIVHRRKRFSSPYFTLFLLSSLVNILTYINSVFALRLPPTTCGKCFLAPIFKKGHFWGLEAIRAGIQLFAYFQYGLSTTVTINRALTVFFPFKFEKFWKKAFLPLLFLTFIFPFILNWDIFSYSSSYIYLAPIDRFLLTADEPPARGVLKMLIFMMICTAFNAVLNTATTVFVINKKTKSVNEKERTEIKLLIHSLLTFLIETISCGIAMMLVFKGRDPQIANLGLALLPYVSDALTFVAPFTLVYFSTSLRNTLKDAIWKKTKTESMVVLSAASVSSR